MPMYDFACENEECPQFEEEVEKLCKVGEIKDCEECGQPMKKLIKSAGYKKIPHISWSTWKI